MNETGETFWTNRSKQVHGYWTQPETIPEYRKMMIQLITEEMKIKPEYTICDCGHGTGLMYEYLPEKYHYNYNGVDFTQEMVDFCRNKYPDHKDRFNRLDLTKIKPEEYDLLDHDILITQNVIQHILLFQEALDNIFAMAKHCVILCERTQQMHTGIAGYDFAVRWRFNVKDFYDILTHYGKKYGYRGDVEIMGQPLTTDGIPKAVTVYRVYRDVDRRVDTRGYQELFKRVPMLMKPDRPPKPFHIRVLNSIKKSL